jgi:hypothetical protein
MIPAYLSMYGTEIIIILALCLGLSLGMWCGFELGRECPKRDKHGRYVKP